MKRVKNNLTADEPRMGDGEMGDGGCLTVLLISATLPNHAV
jgi:hypothetical protein